MTPKEIINRTLQFEPADPVPTNVLVGEDLAVKLDGYYSSREWRKNVIFPYFFGTGGGFMEAGEWLSGDTVREPFGSVVKMGNVPHLLEPAVDGPDLSGYRWPDIEELVNVTMVREHLNNPENQQKYVYAAIMMGYFERGMFFRGAENFLADMIENPDFIHEFCEGYCKLKLQAYDLFCQLGAYDAVFGGGDDCDQRGCIMGIRHWREFIGPRLEREITHAHKLGKTFYMHSCGNMIPILDDLIGFGIDFLEPIQPEPMDIMEVKEKCAGKVVMVGGMGAQTTLPFGTPEEIRVRTRYLLDNLGGRGGYVLGNAKPMYADTPVENAVAFIEASMQGRPLF